MKIVFSFCLSILFFSSTAFSNTLVFTGRVTPKTCEVSVVGSSTGAVILLSENLSSVEKNLKTTPFLIEMKNCGIQGERLKSRSVAEIRTTKDNILNLAGTADNIELQLIDGIRLNKTKQINNNYNSSNVRLNTIGKASIPFMVKYYKKGGPISGTVITSTPFLIVYN